MASRTIQLSALLLAALALIPAGAHLFELPNKMELARDPYFVVQGIYRGWQFFGIVWIASIGANVALAATLRKKTMPFRAAVLAVVCSAGSLAIFFIWTYPTNVATDNWTVAPINWQDLREQWEYSHAVNALLMLIGFAAVCFAVVAPKE